MSSIGYGRAVAAATGRGFKSHQPDNLRREADSEVATANACLLSPVLDTSLATPC
jgi:hypothetical protein